MIVLYLLVLALVLAMCVLAGKLLRSCDFNATVDLMPWKRRASTPNANKARRSSIDAADKTPMGACMSLPAHGSTAMSTCLDNVPAAGTNTIHRTNGADAVDSSLPITIEAQGKPRSWFSPPDAGHTRLASDNRAAPMLEANDFATSCLPTVSDPGTEAPAITDTNTGLRGVAPLNRAVPVSRPRGTLCAGPSSPLTPGHEPIVDEAGAWEDVDGLPLRGQTRVFRMDESSASRAEMGATPQELIMPGTVPEATGEAWEGMDSLPRRGRTQIIRGGLSLLHATETDLQFAAAAAAAADTPVPKTVAAPELTEPDFQSFDEFDFMAHRLQLMFADPVDSTVDLCGSAANTNAIDVMPPSRRQSTTSSAASIGCGLGYVDVMPPSRWQSNTSDASFGVAPLPWDLVDSTVEPVALRPGSHQRNSAFGVRDSMIEEELLAGRGEAMLSDTGGVYYNW